MRPAEFLQPGINRQRVGQHLQWLAAYSMVVLAGLAVGAFAFKRAYQPYFGVALAVLILVICGWVYRPRKTLNVTVFLALLGDIVTVRWFPFNKNLSSRESILFLSDGVSLSPLELVLLTGLAVVGLRAVAAGQSPLSLGAVGRPLLLFTACVFIGLARGMLSGGDFRAAMFEMRPLLYLTIVYLLTTTLISTRRQQRHLVIAAVAAVTVQSLLSLDYLRDLDGAQRDALESLTAHGASISANFLFIVMLASLLYRGVSPVQRIMMVAAAIPVFWVYLVSQRRAAVITLGVAVVLLCILLFWRQRRTFWKVTPALALVLVGYLGAFWNSEASIAFPAQAVKTVIAPDDLTTKDASSDLYRVLENINVHSTIRASPVLGLGFGQAFYRPYRLPDISGFEFNAYVPHNSFLWIWIKTGFVGFASMVYVLTRSVTLGSSRARESAEGPDAVVTTAAVLFVVMYAIYTYVDVAWGSNNMVLLGVAIAIASSRVPAAGSAARPRPMAAGSRAALVATG